jgi:hypothetical protein
MTEILRTVAERFTHTNLDRTQLGTVRPTGNPRGHAKRIV